MSSLPQIAARDYPASTIENLLHLKGDPPHILVGLKDPYLKEVLADYGRLQAEIAGHYTQIVAAQEGFQKKLADILAKSVEKAPQAH
jgi:hypothetical protein